MSSYAPFHDSEPDVRDAEALRRRLEEDGYLFFKGRIPRSDVDSVHDEIWNLMLEQDWVDEDGGLVAEGIVEGDDRFWEVYDPLQKLESFHALAHHFSVLEPLALIMSEPVFVHPRNIGRISFPSTTKFATPPHQDFPLIQGASETYTGWAPLMDCPEEYGGLAILRGSHRVGLYKVHEALGPGGMGISTEKLDHEWVSVDYEAGDLLFFHSHTVHKALPNVTDGGIRISADYRYSPLSQPIVADGLEPHYGRLTWDEIYEGWQNPDLQYYWDRMPVTVSSRDEGLRAALEEHPA